MALIPIDFDGVEAFDNLPLSKYPGQIDKIELKPTTDPNKFDQLMASYLVTDGEFLGRKSSEFLSLSPKAAFRLKKWFDKFGISDSITGLDIDDDTNLLVDPDLVGVDIIFEVYQDPKLYQGEVQVRTRLLEVLDEEPAPAPTPVRATPTRRAAPAAALPNQVEDASVDEDEAEEEAEPVAVAVAPRRFGAKAATATAPARRALR